MGCEAGKTADGARMYLGFAMINTNEHGRGRKEAVVKKLKSGVIDDT
jgi:hypothetical protein